MLDSSPNAVPALKGRTRDRNKSVWVSMLAGTPLALDEITLNSLYLPTIEAPIAVIDEVMEVKEYESKKTFDIASQEVALNTQTIIDGFGFVLSRLNDLYALWQIKDRIEAIKIQNTRDIITETLYLLTVELAGVTLQLTAMQNEITVEAYEKTKQVAELQAEAALKAQLVQAKESLQNIEALSRKQISTLRTQMELLVNAARKWVFLNMDRTSTVDSIVSEWIGKLGG